MIIKSSVAAGFECPSCGEIQIQKLSAFLFEDGRKTVLCKRCQRPFGVWEAGADGKYRVTLLCPECMSPHAFSVPMAEFWQTPLRTFVCSGSEELILATGEREAVFAVMEDSFYLEDGELAEDNNKTE